MRNLKYLSTVAAVVLLAVSAFAADEFKIDPVHSSATFGVRHMVVSTVTGRFTEVTGTIIRDEKDITKSSVVAIIKTASVTTDNAKRDGHIRSGDFFDVEKFPEMRFESKRIEKRGNQFVAIGILTIKGVSKDIELPFEYNTMKTPQGTLMGVSASTKINRQDYGVSWNKVLDSGGVTVGDEVKIELNLEARMAAPAAPSAATTAGSTK